jgi:hypothetical protein
MHEAGELDFCGFDSIYSADWLGMYTTQGARVHAHTHTHTHTAMVHWYLHLHLHSSLLGLNFLTSGRQKTKRLFSSSFSPPPTPDWATNSESFREPGLSVNSTVATFGLRCME